jgi:excisionase family DNA binding protein
VAEHTSKTLKADPGKRSYSVAEAAEILGVSKRSVYNLCAAEAFKTVRIGKKLRISRRSFDEWLDGNSKA